MFAYHCQELMDLKIDKLIQMMTYVHHVKLFVKILRTALIIVLIDFHYILIDENYVGEHEINLLWAMMVVAIEKINNDFKINNVSLFSVEHKRTSFNRE